MKLTIRNWIVYRIANDGIALLARFFFPLKIVGKELIPKKDALLVVCNHISGLDPPLVHSSIPRRTHTMAKRKLFDNKFLRWFMVTIGTIAVDRVLFRKAVTDAVALLREGHCVLIFPEGTRGKDGILKKGDRGAIAIAIRSNCVITPTAIIGSNKVLSSESKYLKRSPIEIRFGQPYRIFYEGNREHVPIHVLTRETMILMEKVEALLPAHMRPSAEQKKEWYKTPIMESVHS
ncbi:MAG: lysophospholipid acyltransferase family protein [Patescibacteria group bacterium]